jgi:hypothetical protein
MQRITDYLAATVDEITDIAGDALPVTQAVDPVAVGLRAERRQITPAGMELLYIRQPQAVRERK